MYQSPAKVGGDQIRLAIQGRVKIRQGFSEKPLSQRNETPMVKSGFVPLSATNGVVQIDQRLRKISLAAMKNAAIAQSDGVRGIEPQHPRVVRDRALEVPLQRERLGPGAVGEWIAGVMAKDFGVVMDRRAKAPLETTGIAAL